jgi:hypothetical protein
MNDLMARWITISGRRNAERSTKVCDFAPMAIKNASRTRVGVIYARGDSDIAQPASSCSPLTAAPVTRRSPAVNKIGASLVGVVGPQELVRTGLQLLNRLQGGKHHLG